MLAFDKKTRNKTLRGTASTRSVQQAEKHDCLPFGDAAVAVGGVGIGDSPGEREDGPGQYPDLRRQWHRC